MSASKDETRVAVREESVLFGYWCKQSMSSEIVVVWISSAAVIGPGTFLLRRYGENVPRGQAALEGVLIGAGALPACALLLACILMALNALEELMEKDVDVVVCAMAIAVAINV